MLASSMSAKALSPNATRGNSAHLALLKMLIKTLDSMSNEQYTWQIDDSVSSIGKHIRHIIDHYTCFFKNLADGYINYDDRPRSSVIEVQRFVARKEIEHITHEIENLAENFFEPLDVYITDDADEEQTKVASNSQRELLYLHSHTLHHMAVFQLILRFLGVSVDSNFALSPSTIKHEQHDVSNHKTAEVTNHG